MTDSLKKLAAAFLLSVPLAVPAAAHGYGTLNDDTSCSAYQTLGTAGACAVGVEQQADILDRALSLETETAAQAIQRLHLSPRQISTLQQDAGSAAHVAETACAAAVTEKQNFIHAWNTASRGETDQQVLMVTPAPAALIQQLNRYVNATADCQIRRTEALINLLQAGGNDFEHYSNIGAYFDDNIRAYRKGPGR